MNNLKIIGVCFITGALLISLITYLGNYYLSLTEKTTYTRDHVLPDSVVVLTSFKGNQKKIPTSEVNK